MIAEIRSQHRPARLPASALGSALLCLSALTWPSVLSRFISLEWHSGNVTVGAGILSVTAAILGIAALVRREAINGQYLRLFPTRRHLFGSLALVGASVTLTLALLELVLWKANLPFSGAWIVSETPLAEFDSLVGWAYLPNHAAVQEFGWAGRAVPMFFDGRGSRVRGPDVHHNPAAPTLILAGCSITMGHGLPWEETIAGRLEANPEFPFQVINLGIQGYGTDQTLLLLRRHMREFNTRVVVYTFIDDHASRNAVHDRRLIYPSARFVGTKPLFKVSEDQAPVLSKRPYRFADAWESRIWGYVRLFWAKRGPVPDPKLTRALIRRMRTDVEAQGAIFVMVRWAGSQIVIDDPQLLVIDLNSLVPPAFRQWVIPGDGHPDARAAAFVADVLSERLERIARTLEGSDR